MKIVFFNPLADVAQGGQVSFRDVAKAQLPISETEHQAITPRRRSGS